MDEDMLGGVTFVDPKQKLKERKSRYIKYELITSHSCRRSFVSNHIGKLPNSELVSAWWMVNRRDDVAL
jgi:hypothetical protein